ncbi:MAG TPA: hypothetical protein VL263_19155 [Vicinamibacterales bacterium]|nr:hypothetical protein [Vicinamibacterales bacterium]
MTRSVVRVCAIAVAMVVAAAPFLAAAELKSATVAAFDRYVRATEARMSPELQDESRFLHVDGLPEAERRHHAAELAAGRLVIERLQSREDGKEIDVPDGLIHHWVGVIFVPRGTAAAAVSLLQDYNRHADIFKPAIDRSRVLEHEGDRYRVFMRFFMKKVVSVTIDSEHEARFTRASPSRAYSRVVSTRVQEVEHAGTPQEHQLPIGNDGGYLWRINSYWRFLERDGGVYVQCESITLSRDIPFGLHWIVGPFVTSIPRESLTFTLETVRRVLAADAK